MTDSNSARNLSGASYEVGGFSSKGVSSLINQDRYRLFDEGFVLCDGMGGLSAGEVFAEASCWQCGEFLKSGMGSEELLDAANDRICALGESLGVFGGTAVCVVRYREDGGFDIGLKGDIAVFQLQSDGIHIVSEGLPRHAYGLESFLGDEGEDCGIDAVSCAPLEREGFLIAMSDGVWRVLSPDDVKSICESAEGSSPLAAKLLVETAQGYGSTDDCSAVVCGLAPAA